MRSLQQPHDEQQLYAAQHNADGLWRQQRRQLRQQHPQQQRGKEEQEEAAGTEQQQRQPPRRILDSSSTSSPSAMMMSVMSGAEGAVIGQQLLLQQLEQHDEKHDSDAEQNELRLLVLVAAEAAAQPRRRQLLNGITSSTITEAAVPPTAFALETTPATTAIHASAPYSSSNLVHIAIISSAATALCLLLLLLASAVLFVILSRRKAQETPGSPQPKTKRSGSVKGTKTISRRPRTLQDVSDLPNGQPFDPLEVPPVMHFKLSEVQKATDQFSAENVLRDLEHRTVFKATGPNGEPWVVKRAKKTQGGELNRLFEKEVKSLQNILHQNLLPLVGYCNDENEQILVYPSMANGNLSYWLRPQSGRPPLTCDQRIQIAKDVCSAIHFLHVTCNPPIVHRDILSDTVLLDENFRVRLGGLGSMKHLPGEPMKIRISRRKPYLDPEYFQTFKYSEKTDVFSFGVILLELITGKPPLLEDDDEPYRTPQNKQVFLSHWVMMRLQAQTIDAFMDPRLEFDAKPRMSRLAAIATKCVGLKRKSRSSISDIVPLLEKL